MRLHTARGSVCCWRSCRRLHRHHHSHPPLALLKAYPLQQFFHAFFFSFLLHKDSFSTWLYAWSLSSGFHVWWCSSLQSCLFWYYCFISIESKTGRSLGRPLVVFSSCISTVVDVHLCPACFFVSVCLSACVAGAMFTCCLTVIFNILFKWRAICASALCHWFLPFPESQDAAWLANKAEGMRGKTPGLLSGDNNGSVT